MRGQCGGKRIQFILKYTGSWYLFFSVLNTTSKHRDECKGFTGHPITMETQKRAHNYHRNYTAGLIC